MVSLALRSPHLQARNRLTPRPRTLARQDRLEVARYVETAVRSLRFFGLPFLDYVAPRDAGISFGLSASEPLEQMDDLDLLARLNATLGIQIRRIIWYFGEPSVSVFVTEKGTITLGSPLDFGRLRRACSEQINHDIPYFSKEMSKVILDSIVKLSVKFNLMPNPWTQKIDPEVLVAGYLALRPATEAPAPISDPSRAYKRGGRTHILRHYFEKWHLGCRKRRARLGEMFADLEACGWKERLVGGAEHENAYWISPIHWLPPIFRK